jgi:hypothetical protein
MSYVILSEQFKDCLPLLNGFLLYKQAIYDLSYLLKHNSLKLCAKAAIKDIRLPMRIENEMKIIAVKLI